MEKNKKFKPVMYKPKVHTQEQMQAGLRRAFQGAKQSSKQVSFKPQQRKQIPKSGQPKFPMTQSWEPYRTTKEPEQEYEDEEPYWTAEQWEEWALDLYANYPEFREILPEWFVEAAEE